MMNLHLSYPISIQLMDGKKKKAKLSIDVREPTPEETAEAQATLAVFQAASKRAVNLSERHSSLIKHRDYNEKLGNIETALEMQEKIDVVVKEWDEATAELEAVGGDDYAETSAKRNFDLLVSGEGKERLEEVAASAGYAYIMGLIGKEKEKIKGKQ